MKEIDVLRRLQRDRPKFKVVDLWGVFEQLTATKQNYKVSFVTFHASSSPDKLFRDANIEGFSVKVTAQEDFWICNLRRTIERSDVDGGKRTIQGEFGFFRTKSPDIWTAFAASDPDFFTLGVLRFIGEFRPEISLAYSTSQEMRRFFERLEEKSRGEVLVNKVVLYSHREEGQITFEKKPYQHVFSLAENEDRYVDKVEYTLLRDGKPELHAFISRSGVSYFYGGKSTYFRDSFLLSLADLAAAKTKMFEGRERKTRDSPLRPLDIVYPKNVFTSPRENMRFIRALANVSKGGIAVFHKNPYVHVTLVDFYDGSSFDVFATQPDRVSIIPNRRSSVHAINRLTEQIFRDFQEGEIQEESDPSYSVEDFFAG